MQKTGFLLLFSLFTLLSFAQNYPVQTTIQLTPPYTSYLPDYTDGVNSKLQIALNITDVNEPVLQVKLKVSLEGPGGKIVTNPNFVQSPITLNFGEVMILSGDELAPYLAFENLLFPSETFRQNYQQTKVLPEGLWKLCVDVVDATNPNSELLSTNNCALLFVARLQPPMLNLPVCETTLPRSQTIFFSWTDMALGSYAIGHEPLYDFSLYAVPISAYENPTQVLNTNPIYTETTTIPSLTIDTNLILLPAGQKYLWQVKARFTDGSGAYLNNGNSAPCVFTFGDLAQEIIDDLTINLTAQGTGPTVGQASWTLTSASGGNSQFDSYMLAYRKAGNEYYSWYEEPVSSLSYLIQQLEDSTEYEVKVKGIIGIRESEWTQSVTFLTQPYPRYACGDENIRPLPPTYQPLLPMNAYEGIRVQQGQFFMDVTSINPTGTGEGHYKGTGRIHIDFLFVNVRVSFSDLLIDDQYNAREGEIMVLTKGLKDWLHDQYGGLVDPTWVSGVIDSVNVIDSVATVYVGGTTTTFTFNPPDYPIIFQDDDGNQFTTYSGGGVEQGTFLDVENEYLDVNRSLTATFIQAPNEIYGFDSKEHIQWHDNYEIIYTRDTLNYFVPNKSMTANTKDYVKVNIPQNQGSSNSFYLRSSKWGNDLNPLSSSNMGETTELSFELPETDAGEYEVYLMDGELKIGKMSLYVYEEIIKDVVIVPISGSIDQTSLNTYLNSLFSEAGMRINVEISDTVGVGKYANDVINIPNATLMAKYSNKMKNIRDSYLDGHEDSDDTYYLFIVSSLQDTVNNQAASGYMVRGRSFGFIKANADNLTIAHELGHGIGALEHTWNDNGPSEGTTSNLMDYNEGDNLLRSQWEFLRNPPLNTLWDDEDDSKYYIDGNQLPGKRNSDGSFSAISPANQIVRLPKSVIYAESAFGANLVKDFPLYPTGTLYQFDIKVGDVVTRYRAKLNSNNEFLGYADPNNRYFQNYEPYNPQSSDANSAWINVWHSYGGEFRRLTNLEMPYLTKSSAPKKVIELLDETQAEIQASFDESVTIEWKDFLRGADVGQFFQSYFKVDIEDYSKQAILMTKGIELIEAYPHILPYVTNNTNINDWQNRSSAAVTSNNLLNGIQSLIDNNYELSVQFIDGYKYDIAGVFDYKVVQKQWDDQQSYSQEFVLKEFLATYLRLILQYKKKNQSVIDAILGPPTTFCTTTDYTNVSKDGDIFIHSGNTTYTIDEDRQVKIAPVYLRNALNAMSSDELERICPRMRVNLVAALADVFETRELLEEPLVRLFNSCRYGKDAVQFLVFLEHYKDENGNYLLREILQKVDDETCFVGTDQFTYLAENMLALYRSMLKRENYESWMTDYYDSRIKPFLEPSGIDNAKVIRENYITYHYESAVKRIFTGIFSPTTYDLISDVSYNNSTGNIVYTNNFEKMFSTLVTTETRSLKPFEPIYYNNEGKAFSPYGPGEVEDMLAPAVLLYFAEKKAISTTATDLTQLGVDVLTFFVPGANTTLALRILNTLDKASSVFSIAGGAVKYDYPEISSVLNMSSTLLGLTNLSASDFSDLSHVNTAAKANLDGIYQRQKTFFTNTDYSTEVGKVCDNFKNKATYTQKEKEFALDLMEKEKKLALIENKTVLVNKINQTIQHISGANIYSGTINAFDALVTNGKLTKSSNIYSAGGIQFARIDPQNGFLVKRDFFKSDFTKLDADPEFVGFLDDVDYVKVDNLTEPSGVTPVKTDLFIFKKDGKVFCLSGSNCFTANTKVSTMHGFKNIQDIQVGDSVMAYNEQTQQKVYNKVLDTFKKQTKRLQMLVLDKDTLFATPEHLFLSGKKWLAAGAIAIGTYLQTSAGVLMVKENRSIEDTSATVYNFTVADQHTYFVGTSQIVTHNDCNFINSLIEGLDDNLKSAFMATLKSDAEFLTLLKNGSINIDSWKLMIEAIGSSSTKLALDIPSLKKMTTMMAPNSSFRNAVGTNWRQEMKDLLIANSDLRCAACGNLGQANLPKMDEFLENVDYIYRFGDKPGFSTVNSNLKSSTNFRDGINHMITHMRNNQSEFAGVVEFEFRYNDDFLNKADVLVGTRKYEFKSWTYGTANPWNSFFAGTGDSYTQFIRYLENTDKINDLKYVFNVGKATEAQVKDAFKALFASKKQEIFDVIWANEGLRNNLFSNILQGVDDINLAKNSALTNFDVLCNNTNSIFYSFIKSE